MLPIVVEKTVKLTGLDWEDQCIFGTQSEIGLFPADEESLYARALSPTITNGICVPTFNMNFIWSNQSVLTLGQTFR